MARVQVVRCDFCDAEKREANHWFRIYESNTAVAIAPFGGSPISNIGDELAIYAQDACGLNCVSRAISRWSEEISKKEEAHEDTDNR